MKRENGGINEENGVVAKAWRHGGISGGNSTGVWQQRQYESSERVSLKSARESIIRKA